MYLSLCNGKWLKFVWIFVFFLMCVLQVKCDKGRESSSYQVYIKLVTLMYSFFFSSIKLKYYLFFILVLE
jgi:hypothetical protein